MVFIKRNTLVIRLALLCLILNVGVFQKAFCQGKHDSGKGMPIRINSLNLISQSGYGDIYRMEASDIGYFYTFGVNAGTEILGLPFNYSYSYGNSPGANLVRPQFKLRLDYNKYRNSFVLPDVNLLDSLNRQISKLENEINQGQNTLNSYHRNLDRLGQSATPFDSLGLPEFSNNQYVDSLGNLYSSISKEQGKLDSLSNKLRDLKGKINELKSVSQNRPNRIFQSKNFTPKALNIGISSPEMGTFLLQGMTIRGFHSELKYKKFDHSIAVGTVNSFLLNTATGSPYGNIIQRVDDLLKINTSSSDRRIISYKFSKGEPDSTHFYIGTLAGTGKRNLLESKGELARNFVGEFGKGVFIPSLGLFSAKISQSWISNSTNTFDENSNSIDSRKVLGNAFNLLFKGINKKHEFDYSLSSSLITPTFNSYGLALQRRDYLRSDLNLSKRFKTKTQIKLAYRRDESNIFKSSEINTKSEIFRMGISQKLKRTIFLNNDFILVKNRIWNSEISNVQDIIINNAQAFVLFPKSKHEEGITSLVSFSKTSGVSVLYSIESTYGRRLTKQVNLKIKAVHQALERGGVSSSIQTFINSVEMNIKDWSISMGAGANNKSRNVDWVASTTVTRNKGKFTFSLSAERFVPSANLMLTEDGGLGYLVNPYRAFLNINYAILN